MEPAKGEVRLLILAIVFLLSGQNQAQRYYRHQPYNHGIRGAYDGYLPSYSNFQGSASDIDQVKVTHDQPASDPQTQSRNAPHGNSNNKDVVDDGDAIQKTKKQPQSGGSGYNFGHSGGETTTTTTRRPYSYSAQESEADIQDAGRKPSAGAAGSAGRQPSSFGTGNSGTAGRPSVGTGYSGRETTTTRKPFSGYSPNESETDIQAAGRQPPTSGNGANGRQPGAFGTGNSGTAGRPSAGAGSGGSPRQEDKDHWEGMPFGYEYGVKDDETANDYMHRSESNGDIVTGEYRTLMPDGRTQVVSYTADWKNGYKATVKYLKK